MNNDRDYFFWLNTIANLLQIESYELLLKDADNNDIMRHLEQQDKILNEQTNDYLKLIVKQNNEIIKLLKERRLNDEKTNES